MNFLPVVLAGALGVVASGLAFVVLRRPAFLPTAGWITLMVTPFVLQVPTFSLPYAGLQAIGIGTVLSGLWASDCVVHRKWFRAGTHPAAPNGRATAIFASAFVIPAGIHVLMMEHAPLSEAIWNRGAGWHELMLLREKSAKLLDAPELLKITFNWAMTIFAPATAIALGVQRRWVAALITVGIGAIYALLTLAKTPIVLLAYTLVVAGWLVVGRSRQRRLAPIVALAIGCVFGTLVWIGVSEPRSFFNWRPTQLEDGIAANLDTTDDVRLHLTLGDYARIRPPEVTSQIGPLAASTEYVLYRMFVVPPEVSYRWYQFFSSGERLGLSGLGPYERGRADFVHPAQSVAKWALGSRFPDKYPSSSRAYASVDADGFARFGVPGVLLVAVALAAARLVFGYASRSGSSLPFQAVGLAMLSALPAVGSLGAILVSQGLVVVILCAFALERCSRTRGGPSTESSARNSE